MRACDDGHSREKARFGRQTRDASASFDALYSPNDSRGEQFEQIPAPPLSDRSCESDNDRQIDRPRRKTGGVLLGDIVDDERHQQPGALPQDEFSGRQDKAERPDGDAQEHQVDPVEFHSAARQIQRDDRRPTDKGRQLDVRLRRHWRDERQQREKQKEIGQQVHQPETGDTAVASSRITSSCDSKSGRDTDSGSEAFTWSKAPVRGIP